MTCSNVRRNRAQEKQKKADNSTARPQKMLIQRSMPILHKNLRNMVVCRGMSRRTTKHSKNKGDAQSAQQHNTAKKPQRKHIRERARKSNAENERHTQRSTK